MKYWKRLILSALVSALAACGSGGDSGSRANSDAAVSRSCRSAPSIAAGGSGAGSSTTLVSGLSGLSGIAVYQGNMYIGSGSQIRRFVGTDPTSATTYYDVSTLAAGLEVVSLRVYGAYLYAVLRHTTVPAQGRIVKFNLNSTSAPVTVVGSLNEPRSVVVFDGTTYYTESSRIGAVDGNGTPSVVVNATTMGGGSFSPVGLDMDGTTLYFTHATGVYAYDFSSTPVLRATLSSAGDDLQLYGLHAYVSSRNADSVYRVRLSDWAVETYQALAGAESPSALSFANEALYIASPDTGTVFKRSVNGLFAANFTRNSVAGVHTYTLNNNFSISQWEEVGFESDKVIIDGNGNTISVGSLNTEALFFGGGRSASNRLEIKNLKIVANANTISSLLRSFGYVKFSNVHLELTGNLMDRGGGLAYNDKGLGTYAASDIEVDNASVVVNGKIGESGGGLLGLFVSGTQASITDSFSIVLDSDPDPNPISSSNTLVQGSGALVGSLGGGNVSISNSYVIFNGSMTYGAGVIAGRYLGAGSAVTLDKVFAITNIKSVVTAGSSTDNSQYPYLLGFYAGALFNSLSTSQVNFLNLDISIPRIYGQNSGWATTYTGISSHTSYAAYDAAANAVGARVGTRSISIVHDRGAVRSTYSAYSPTNNWAYDVKLGATTCVLEPL